MNSYNYYKNMREEDAPHFDQAWESAADKFGFNSSVKSLPYGSGVGRPVVKKSNSYNPNDYYADNQRGHYMPSYLKGQDMPVRVNKPDTHVERLMPTDTSHR